jgi:hypothetical protein
MPRKPATNHVKRFPIAVVMGLALIALAGCYLRGGPFRHAFYGGPYHRGGYEYQNTADNTRDFYPETGGYGHMAGYRYRQRGYCGW